MENGGTMDTGLNNFVCTICYDIFLYPVRLPCNHRFCKSCLDKHLENNTMSCPICRFRVSNWLRQLRRNNADVVDKPFWDTIKKLYPEEVDKRMNGHIDCEGILKYFRQRLRDSFDDNDKHRCAKVHQAFLDARYQQDEEDDWPGWPDPVFQVCRNILQCITHDQIDRIPATVWDTPRRKIAKQGEIHQEYEELLQKELEEKRREDEENFRLSEAMIRMIEDEERREEEERIKQLLQDEELARRLAEERTQELQEDEDLARRMERETETDCDRTSDAMTTDGSDVFSPSTSLQQPPLMERLDAPSSSRLVPRMSGLDTPERGRRASPGIHLDTPSSSKENVFAKFFISGSPSSSSSHSSQEKSSHETSSTDPKTSSISNKELSHFAAVPSTSGSGAKSKKKKDVIPPSSRCSSGCDSIGQELNHFKPIRTSPTTPCKDGSKGTVPKVVVAQRGVVPDLNSSPLSPLDLLAADISLDELETSINIEKQLEEDRRLAMEIQKQLNEEVNTPSKADYNLRKRKRPLGSLKKKVLLDRSQSTLDNLLIK